MLNGAGTRTLTATFQGGTLFQSSSDTETHQVIAPDQPPVAQDDNYSANAGVTLAVPAQEGVLANDSDAEGEARELVEFDTFRQVSAWLARGLGGEPFRPDSSGLLARRTSGQPTPRASKTPGISHASSAWKLPRTSWRRSREREHFAA